ncbi:hypothetical protein [Fibrobacter sp. UWB13]|uniref:hypothetical protein n=1 Tax=Fibrobacter sp. UWB13 TaxID=1896204 RepID=UPI000A0A80CD|nr:hypothetical protein [Fibrobacter sp. UWB13]SMG10601.1 hypothetical protein SAMN05720489_0306 [Fibrobacter sp. UWB13]
MKKAFLLVLFVACFVLMACSNYTRKFYTEIPLAEGEKITPATEFCYFEDFPQNVPFKVLKPLVMGKSFYGSAASIRDDFAYKAKHRGGNAVANYHESQRFGFWPWRLIRPVISGDVIVILNSRGKSCAEMGGSSYYDLD